LKLESTQKPSSDQNWNRSTSW